METQIGQPVVVNHSNIKQIDQNVLDTVLTTNAPDQKAKAECRICHEDEKSGSLIAPCKCSGSMARVHQSCLQLTMSRCPEIAAQDKLRHVIFCFSIIFMLLCLNIFFVAFANLRDRTEKSKNSKGDDKDDILLVVFGVSFFVAIMVAFISQRHATLSIIQVAKQFFRNSKEWTVTSMGKQLDEAAEEEV
ncbi:hypothetical protein ACJMK2_042320 [Sinanodonta woodiana]|uniref:RING-CH-type domain-containing protein n=1 Tax=Sinanodonta woodiana TaxID=1069815 RepID=A0ABD3W7Z3_SINWO